jgi:hypothetical protein
VLRVISVQRLVHGWPREERIRKKNLVKIICYCTPDLLALAQGDPDENIKIRQTPVCCGAVTSK